MSEVTASPSTEHRLLNSRRLLAFGIGFAVALAVVLLSGVQTHITYSEDIYKFAQIGRNLADGKGFSFDGIEPTMRRAPLYPGLISLTYLLGANSTFPLKIEIGRMVYNTRTGQLAAILTAFHPMVFRYVPDVQVENFLAFLFALTVYLSVRFARNPNPFTALLMGITGGLAALVKASVLAYPPIFMLIWLLMLRRQRRGGLPAWGSREMRQTSEIPRLPLVSAALVLVGMGLVILPWTYRNYKFTGGKIVLVSSNAGGEFLRSFVYLKPEFMLLKRGTYTDAEYEANVMEIELFKAQGKVWEEDEVETETVLNKAAKEKLLSDPLGAVSKSLRGLLSFWYMVAGKTNAILLIVLALGAWTFTLLGIPSARREHCPQWLVFTPILTVWFTYALLLALGRYSSTVIPILMIPTAWGILSLRRHSVGAD
jgi:hypothetical protein